MGATGVGDGAVAVGLKPPDYFPGADRVATTPMRKPWPAQRGDTRMDLKGKLRQGMRIFGADNRDYGTIDRYDDDYVYVGQRRIPTSAFERAENDRLYLGQ